MTQDEVRELYADSHIFILSSVTAANGDREGQGLVLQEAQAMGLPVLSTLHNGIPDGVLDGESGFLVPEKDADALAEKLTYLIENPENWPEMGLAGRKFVEERYDINKLNDRLVKIYEQILNVA
jgi:colanic acid/amylovoran biosynthesis glycosyltransferase